MKYKAFVLTILASVAFFNYHALIDERVAKLLFYVDVLVCAFFALRDGVSLKGVKYPRTEYILLLSSILFSGVMATAFHSQSITVSMMTLLPYIFSYAFFLVLMKLDIPRHKVMNTYIVLCAISSVVYFCNVATMPNNIFGEPILNEDVTRGVIRIPVVFIEMFPLLVFYGINQWLLTKEKRWIVLIGWALVMIFLCVTRQIIAATLVLGAWFFFRRISAMKKMLMAIAAVCIVVFVLPMIPIYKTMVELSEDQRDSNDETEDIRIQAWRYYTYENQTNAVTPLLGNGMPSFGNSLWGKMFESETEVNGCYAADVGWAGFFYYFGAIATASLLIIMLKATLKRKPKHLQFLTYWMIYIMLTSIASGPIVYYNWITSISVVLYLIFKKDDSDDATDTDGKGTQEQLPDVADHHDNILPKYPQLKR